MNRKGQGALEYLLLIGGAVLVAAIVIAVLTGVPSTQSPSASAYCASLSTTNEATCIAADPDTTTTTGSCEWNSTDKICYYDAEGTVGA